MESVNIKELNERIQKESAFVDIITMEMNKVIVGQKHLVENLLIGLLADGHKVAAHVAVHAGLMVDLVPAVVDPDDADDGVAG